MDMAEYRVGGYVTYRKPSQATRTALIRWINLDGSMRVEPLDGGRKTVVWPADVKRVQRKRRVTG